MISERMKAAYELEKSLKSAGLLETNQSAMDETFKTAVVMDTIESELSAGCNIREALEMGLRMLDWTKEQV